MRFVLCASLAALGGCSLLAPSDETLGGAYSGGSGGAASSASVSSAGGGGGFPPLCPDGYLDADGDETNGCDEIPAAGMKFWYAADDLTTSSLSLWPDRSGAGRDAIQNDDPLKPLVVPGALAGKNVVRFDGGQFLTLPAGFTDLDQGLTFFIVAQREASAGGYATLLDLKSVATGAGRYFSRHGSSNDFVYGLAGGSEQTVTTSDAYPVGVPLLLVVRHDVDDSVQIRVCGGELVSTRSPMPPSFEHDTNSLGSNRGTDPLAYHHGFIAETLFYRGALADPDVARVESYLSDKWQPCDPR